ncbi:hypothetical protein N7520_008220 [Penicillium odoratum]|uniref:uncharacterized protein n=1 Tax=Penicillium odoratum TaxID=1167516 RepID=UPI002547DE4D|nr:uncharacterized protein N7520_008220 [Penicillium odoratum]KAJ5761064.1 hypothetical protein N7520_008220 [Penicillium odoratum]
MSPLDTDADQPLPQPLGEFHARFSIELMKSMDAETLPPKAKVDAFTDAYFQHLYHRAPVIDRADLQTEPSKLLSQAICMVGSLLRHPGIQSPLQESEEYYCKAKALLYANYEVDHRNILKALCLLIFRNVSPPKVLTLDCSWQWTGLATRLAYQMGLHRESTYSKLTNPGNARRMMWFLFAQDKLLSACFGRPSFIRTAELDLRPLQLQDFERQDIQAEIFIEYVKLGMITGHMVDCHGREGQPQYGEVTAILQSLQQWINNLTSQLRLYDGNDRRYFRRDVCELHINYFVCVVVLCRLFGTSLPPATASAVSLVASSCISHLYEEIIFRDEINYMMPLNNWFLMVACAPQIQQSSTCQGKDTLCTEELKKLMTALRYMNLKWPPARILLAIIERLAAKSHQEMNSLGQTPDSSLHMDSLSETWSRILPHSDLRALFPFPTSLSPRIQHPDVGSEDTADYMALERMDDMGNDDLDWIFHEYQLGYMEASLN